MGTHPGLLELQRHLDDGHSRDPEHGEGHHEPAERQRPVRVHVPRSRRVLVRRRLEDDHSLKRSGKRVCEGDGETRREFRGYEYATKQKDET